MRVMTILFLQTGATVSIGGIFLEICVDRVSCFICSWPIAEIVDAEINAHLSSAHKRTAEFNLVRVVLAAIDPQQPLASIHSDWLQVANSGPTPRRDQ